MHDQSPGLFELHDTDDRHTIRGRVMNNEEELLATLDRIARALETLSRCVWKNPDGEHVFNVEEKTYKPNYNR